jgi:hypothetical protein
MSLKIENLKKELLLKDRQLMQLQELCRRLRSADAEIRENDQMGENDDDSGTSSNKVVENKDKDGNVL